MSGGCGDIDQSEKIERREFSYSMLRAKLSYLTKVTR